MTKSDPCRSRLSPRMDATVNELVKATLCPAPDRSERIRKSKPRTEYRYRRPVYHPEIPYRDEQCAACHTDTS